jgi:hypothetical protein
MGRRSGASQGRQPYSGNPTVRDDPGGLRKRRPGWNEAPTLQSERASAGNSPPQVVRAAVLSRRAVALVVILAVLWFLGMVPAYTLDGLFYLLILAAVAIVIRLMQGRRPLQALVRATREHRRAERWPLWRRIT